ncbi:Nuclear Envelope Integral Membrane Protein 2 [Manis pentadactyla]|nr:Nuclear Envelope Integral Membrane Protein 2 [Manis pentadactyla]
MTEVEGETKADCKELHSRDLPSLLMGARLQTPSTFAQSAEGTRRRKKTKGILTCLQPQILLPKKLMCVLGDRKECDVNSSGVQHKQQNTPVEHKILLLKSSSLEFSEV